MKNHPLSLTLFVLSLLALIGSFYFPFFSIQLKMEVSEAVGAGKDLIITGMAIPIAGNYITDITNNFFWSTLFSQTCQADWSIDSSSGLNSLVIGGGLSWKFINEIGIRSITQGQFQGA